LIWARTATLLAAAVTASAVSRKVSFFIRASVEGVG
jgi:hypothetical protein